MKKTLLSLLALLAISEAGNAQVSGMNIGYCQGNAGAFPSTENNYFSDMSTKKKTWTSCAILLKEERIKSLSGNQIQEVKAALTSKLNVDSLAVWVSESLDGPVLSSDTITTMQKGWNTVKLSKAVDITNGMKNLYIGYSYHQKSTCKAMSCLETGVPGFSCFTRSGNDEWKDYSETLTACVEANVYGDNLPKYDLSLVELTVPKNYIVDKGKMELSMLVRNNATVTINSFDAVCSFDGTDEKYTAHCTEPIAYNESKLYTFTIEPKCIQTMDPEERTISVTLDNLAEGTDETPGDNTMTGNFNVLLHSFVRNVLLEEFTTEKCPNCPRVANFVHKAMEEPDFAGRLNTMENHAGYYTDQLTTTFHDAWRWFYDNEFAPAVMYDRHANDGAITPITSPSTSQELFANIRNRMIQDAFVSLKVTASLDKENQKINVKVTGARSKKDFTRNPARITVVLTETNLKALAQAGAGTDYYHYNVGRRVNSTWGDVLEWNGDDYTYECSIPYTQDYNMDNVGILAFVHDYDPDDKTKCDVANSAAITSAEFDGYVSGITSIKSEANGKEKIFDIAGRPQQNIKQGMNIIVKNGKVIKVVK